MKTFILALLFSVSANAIQGNAVVGKCYSTYNFEYEVIAKIDKRHYELRGNWLSPHALLETDANVGRTGTLAMQIKFMGSKTMELDNGFKAVVDLWGSCK